MKRRHFSKTVDYARAMDAISLIEHEGMSREGALALVGVRTNKVTNLALMHTQAEREVEGSLYEKWVELTGFACDLCGKRALHKEMKTRTERYMGQRVTLFFCSGDCVLEWEIEDPEEPEVLSIKEFYE